MRTFIFICLLHFLIYPHAVQAKVVTFEEQYTYHAGEADSKLSCRAISLLQAKRLLIEKLGIYLESRTAIVNSRLTKDQITSLSAGIVKTEIIDEKWDGKIYSLTARIEVDPDNVEKAINDLRKSSDGREKIERLENVNEQSIEKIEELKNELNRIQRDLITINRDYNSASQVVHALDLFETGLQMSREGKYQDSIDVLTKAIELDPNYRHYYNRGMGYMGLRQYDKAEKDFSIAISLTPDMKNAYFQRARTHMKMGQIDKGLDDMRKAAELGSGSAKRWLKLRALQKGIGR